jgi:hypothetical protein
LRDFGPQVSQENRFWNKLAMADSCAAFERRICQINSDLKAPEYQLWIMSLLSRLFCRRFWIYWNFIDFWERFLCEQSGNLIVYIMLPTFVKEAGLYWNEFTRIFIGTRVENLCDVFNEREAGYISATIDMTFDASASTMVELSRYGNQRHNQDRHVDKQYAQGSGISHMVGYR